MKESSFQAAVCWWQQCQPKLFAPQRVYDGSVVCRCVSLCVSNVWGWDWTHIIFQFCLLQRSFVLAVVVMVSVGVCFRFSYILLSFCFIIYIFSFSLFLFCRVNFYEKMINRSKFQTPLIRIVSGRCFVVRLQMMVLIMFESKVTHAQQKHCYQPHHFHQSLWSSVGPILRCHRHHRHRHCYRIRSTGQLPMTKTAKHVSRSPSEHTTEQTHTHTQTQIQILFVCALANIQLVTLFVLSLDTSCVMLHKWLFTCSWMYTRHCVIVCIFTG